VAPTRLFGKIDLGELPDYFRAVTQRPEADRFLRAAVKAGLRLQQNETAEAGGGTPGAGVRTLQRIKSSLRKRNSKREKICDTK
jgi:hypothetical protein